MSRPLISILVITYNNQEDIEECLLSTLKQKTTFSFEVLCYVSASLDETKTVVEKVKEKYPSLEAHYALERTSSAKGREALLPFAKGDYVLFLDGDDALEENALEVLMQTLIAENSSVVSCSYARYIGGKKKPYFFGKNATYTSQKQIFNALFADISLRSFMWGKLMKKDLFLQNRYVFDDINDCFEDIPVIASSFLKIDKLVLIKNPLVLYRLRKGSLTESSHFQKRTYRHILALLAVRLTFEKEGAVIPLKSFFAHKNRIILSLLYDKKRDKKLGGSKEYFASLKPLIHLLFQKKPLLGTQNKELLLIEKKWREMEK